MIRIDKLSHMARRLLLVPMVALAPVVFSSAPLLLGTAGAQAAQLQASSQLVIATKRGTRPSTGTSFVGIGGPKPDTCNATTADCDLDELIARCDAAGGGLSTQPGGGVDCSLAD